MTGDTVGGVWTFALDLARGLRPYGIGVVLASLGGEPSDEQRAEAESIPNLILLTSRYKLEWMDDPWRDVEESGRWLLDIQKQFRPDVIHLNSYGHGSLPWKAPVILTAHSCVLSWWAAVRGDQLPPCWNRYRQAVESSIQTADVVTTPSRVMLRMLKENYAAHPNACRVIPNGRRGGCYRPGPKEPFVLTAGRLWDEAKNAAAVARVASRLPWPVYLAGECVHPNGSPVEFGVCRMLGRLSPGSLAEWYGRAAIYVLPARYEPFGLSVLEAALSGCALVLGAIESLRELWDDAAVFVPADDEDRLEDALRRLMKNPAEREELGRRSAARAHSFTAERMARSYANVYGSVSSLRGMACAS
jgi:glycosyltransferase involved in cell wall biosynthesis